MVKECYGLKIKHSVIKIGQNLDCPCNFNSFLFYAYIIIIALLVITQEVFSRAWNEIWLS